MSIPATPGQGVGCPIVAIGALILVALVVTGVAQLVMVVWP